MSADPRLVRRTAPEEDPARPAAGRPSRRDDPSGADARLGTQVVGRVFDILDAFVIVGPRLTVTDVSRELGLKYATAHRILEAMAARGVLDRDPDSRRYSVGARLREYGSVGHIEDFDVAHPYLEDLTRTTGETSHLAILDDRSAVYIDTVGGARLLSAHRHIGRRMPLHCTGVGKALLSGLLDSELDGLLNVELARYTRRTIVDPDRLRAELRQIRDRGYAVDDEETEEGLVCIAAPLRDHSGQVIAAVSVGGPATRLRQDLETVAGEVIRSAAALSRASGWTG